MASAVDRLTPPISPPSMALRGVARWLADERLVLGVFPLVWFALYGPAYLFLSATAWARPENGHAPILLAICFGLAVARLSGGALRLAAGPGDWGASALGTACTVMGVAAFIFARIQEVEFVLTATQPLVALGLILVLFGWAGFRRFWFILVLSFYLIAWPGWLIDMLTFPLKLMLAEQVAGVLFAVGLPVSHDGAVLQVGPYALLVADACAGLNSLIALTSVGVVYLYAVRRGGWPVILTVGLCLVPIAVLANMIRVALLVLLTHYAGYDAGQGFLHDFSGLFMFVCALFLVFGVEALAVRVFGRPAPAVPGNDHAASVAATAVLPAPGKMRLVWVWANYLGVLTAAAALGFLLRSAGAGTAAQMPAPPDLETLIPAAFEGWSGVPLSDAVLPPETTAGPGEVIVYRAYRDGWGRVVTLVVAYGPPASDTVRLHRPETCYVGQGFSINNQSRAAVETASGTVPINRLMARNAARREAVSYWLRAGPSYATSAAAHQWINLQQGFGRRADGVLVRLSSFGSNEAEFALHDRFTKDFVRALSPAARQVLLTEQNRR
ncbi:MAG: exosortase C-terminal domain/associated protein EpsI [Pseudomonadota bacterium]